MTEIARDVVIVGGSSAGLTAAHELRMAGLSVAVFEAHDRIGDEHDALPQLLAERLGEDVLLSRAVHTVQWSPRPSVVAISDATTVHARFAIFAHRGMSALAIVPGLDPSATEDIPIHFATDDDAARTIALSIVATARS